MLAQRPRETDPGYDLPAASSLSDADSFLQVKPFLRLLAGLCGQVRAVPLPGVPPVCLPAGGDRAAVRLRPLAGGPWSAGRWHGLRILAKETARVSDSLCAGLFTIRFRMLIRNLHLALSGILLPGLFSGFPEPGIPCPAWADTACSYFPGGSGTSAA